MYSVTTTSRAERELKRLDRNVKNRIVSTALGLSSNPRPHGCLKVKTAEGQWRIRVGDWRIGYEIDDEARTVTIITIGHRREFYD
ncbi:MAG TPA: type II toxin-antitoxin system RelE/ParE family toxin [Pyrinomonadaceae bacterium]|jgi:mRNA interferase RelE/StbE|nr:type II toxin-antitoxin system RelE/ParE family toxin [Pyrinomonadaceae bacterium]